METAVPYSYKDGSSLYSDDPTYVERTSDRKLFEALQARESCYVVSPWQMGKTSLAIRARDKLINLGFDCPYIDLSTMEASTTPSQWHVNIADAILEELEISPAANFWESFGSVSPTVKLFKVIEKLVLPRVSHGLVIFFEEFDSILDLKSDAVPFLEFISACHRKKLVNHTYRNLSFCILGVTPPNVIDAEGRRRSFRYGKVIEPGNIEFENALPKLRAGLLELEDPTAGLREILDWTSGHPFLTQKICRLVAEAIIVDESASVSQIIQSTLVNNWSTYDEPRHLRNIAKQITQNERAKYLLDLYEKILIGDQQELKSNEPLDLEKDRDEVTLVSTGIVERDVERRLRVHNRVYKTVFGFSWIQSERTKLLNKRQEGLSDDKNGAANLIAQDGSRKEKGIIANDGAVINVDTVHNYYPETKE